MPEEPEERANGIRAYTDKTRAQRVEEWAVEITLFS